MRKWFWISIFAVTLTAVALQASGQDAKQLAQKGHRVFVEVLGGDESKYAEAIKYMEESLELDPADASNLYNLGRAYFYEFLTHGNRDAVPKAERTFSKLLEVKPLETRALSFHGAILTLMSGGKDIAMFMKGVQEMKTAVEKADPSDLNAIINNRIVIAFTSQNFPPQALAAMGNYDALKDLEFVRNSFDGRKFYYAPHADTVMKALVGEAYKKRGDEAKARENFEAALAVAKPSKEGERAGREITDTAIRGRMNGGEKIDGIALGSCHSCHLNAPDKLLR